ncbi:MAG TPA: hypothetical protein PKM21_03825 [Anaerolineales bacterium]|nr:hypothetical protein [Anaerolineales bacterium]
MKSFDMRLRVIIGVCSIVGIIFGAFPAKSMLAFGWSAPLSLSGSNPAWFPKMVADKAGYVHVMWGEWVGSGLPSVQAANTIFYRYWDGFNWSEPIDTFASSTTIYLDDLEVTEDGQLVAAWGDDLYFYLSYVSIGDAARVTAWKTTKYLPDTSVVNAKIAISPVNNRIYLSYGALNKIFLTSTLDGLTWEPVQTIWTSTNSSIAVTNGDIMVNEDGRVKLSFTENSVGKSWGGAAIWYTDFDPLTGNTQMREILRLDSPSSPTLGWPRLASNQMGQEMMFWNNGVGSLTGRFFQISDDDGQNWGTVRNAFVGELSGQTGFPALAADSLGRFHLITSAQTPSGITQLCYAVWDGREWSSYTPLWPELRGEHPALVVTGGNLLHVVWNSYADASIRYSSLLLDTPYLPPGSYQSPSVLEITSTPPPMTASPTPTPLLLLSDSAPVILGAEAQMAILLWGGLPVVVLIGILMIAYLRKR